VEALMKAMSRWSALAGLLRYGPNAKNGQVWSLNANGR
jgi:hypothetical protein